MSFLQMQRSKELREHAKKAKQQAKTRYRPIGMDETVDLSTFGEDTPTFFTVPRGIDDLRLNKKSRLVELLRNGQVIETVNKIDHERFDEIWSAVDGKTRAHLLRKLDEAERQLDDLEAEERWLDGAEQEIHSWPANWAVEISLQRPSKCRTSDIIDAVTAERVVATPPVLVAIKQRISSPPTPFLVEHDWAAAFRNARDFDEGDFRLPYDNVMFEFVVCNKTVCALLTTDEPPIIFVAIKDGWVAVRAPNFELEDESLNALRLLIKALEAQVRAISIALDAEVAVKDVVRADDKLNRARTKRGKPPILDYHIIRLSRRERVAPLEYGEEAERRHRSPRLHFVRGHWRHFQSHKTWIRWHLRGDPDLGFIDKHYRL